MITSDEALANVELFRGICSKGLSRVAAVTSEQSYGPGEVIFREGDAGSTLYIILEGKVRISRTVPGMGEEALAVLAAGASFGEMALIEDAPRSADAIAHERCGLLAISKLAIEELLFVDKELAYEVLWNAVRILSKRLRATNDKMTFMTLSARF